MLIKCKECAAEISDRAVVCPHCGFPQTLKMPRKITQSSSRKRLKFPNGFGSVYKLTGNRRKPWAAAKTFGWINDEDTKTSKQEKRIIGYFETEADAITALVNFNKNPYDIDVDHITFSEVYEKWSEEYYPTLSNPSSYRSYTAAFKHCRKIHAMRFKDLRVSHLEGVINDCPAGDSTKARMKSMFNMMYKYALKYEIADKDYAQLFSSVTVENKIVRKPWTIKEIESLWKLREHDEIADLILFQIYTGTRPIECLEAKIENFHLSENYFIGGAKTDAGRERVIPIHPDIRELVREHYEKASSNGWTNLFEFPYYGRYDYKPIGYNAYKGRYARFSEDHNIDHYPADCRHTFITCAKEYEMNEWILKLIVGHETNDVTEKVYTHRRIIRLVEAVEALDFLHEPERKNPAAVVSYVC